MSSTSVSTGNTPEKELDKVPLNDRGEPYLYCMLTPDNETLVYSDSVEELLEMLIPEYTQLDEKEQIVKRIMLANITAAYVQGVFLGEAEEENLLTQYQWEILLAPKTGPNAPSPIFWEAPVPLIVLDTTYEPYTSIPRPCGREDGIKTNSLIWLCPSDPEKFLVSLSEIGHIRLMRNNEL